VAQQDGWSQQNAALVDQEDSNAVSYRRNLPGPKNQLVDSRYDLASLSSKIAGLSPANELTQLKLLKPTLVYRFPLNCT